MHELQPKDDAMGIFVDYYSYLECSEEEVLDRLGRFRERVSELGVQCVS